MDHQYGRATGDWYLHACDWCDAIAAASHAQVAVDQSRCIGNARIQIVGGWLQSLAAYQLLLHSLAGEEAVTRPVKEAESTKIASCNLDHPGTLATHKEKG